MTRRQGSRRWDGGSILDAPPSVDSEAWETDSIVTPAKPARAPQACCCPPPESAHHLGGCRPVLLLEDGVLRPICAVCRKALISGRHRRRAQTHVLGLSALGAHQLDLDDLRDAGLLEDAPPEPTITP